MGLVRLPCFFNCVQRVERYSTTSSKMIMELVVIFRFIPNPKPRKQAPDLHDDADDLGVVSGGSRRPHPLAHAQCHGATPLPPWRSQQRTRLRGRCQWVDVSKWTVPRFMAVHSSQWHGVKLVPFHLQRLCPLEDVAPHVQSYWP